MRGWKASQSVRQFGRKIQTGGRKDERRDGDDEVDEKGNDEEREDT